MKEKVVLLEHFTTLHRNETLKSLFFFEISTNCGFVTVTKMLFADIKDLSCLTHSSTQLQVEEVEKLSLKLFQC